MYHARHRVAVRFLYFAIENIAFQLTTYIYFLNPARRPQDALRQRWDGVKEDYYV